MIDEFDTGPLSLVKREIETVLTRADEGVIAFSVTPDEHDKLTRTVLPSLHQVSGVLRMIGLESAGRVAGTVEKLVEGMACADINGTSEVIGTVRGAIKALNQYLDSLMQGEPNRPLVLFPAYQAVLAATGSKSASEIDLFYPDLSLSPNFDANPNAPVGEDLTKLIKNKRTDFQRGILNLLRTTDFHNSLSVMASALVAIDAVSPPERRALWGIAIAFFEGLATSATAPDVFQKQLCGRVDAQIKLQLEGAAEVPEGLVRELLLSIAYVRQPTERIRKVQETYRLASLLPAAEGAETTRVKLFLNDLKEQIESAKDMWLSVTGNKAGIGQFAKQAAQLNDLARSFNEEPLQALFANLVEVGNNLNTTPRSPGDALALEVATALLVIRDALDNYPQLGSNFDQLSKTVIIRVTAALKGTPLGENDPPRITDSAWAAREKQLCFQVGLEILSNLKEIEDVLDGFFRDSARRSELAKIVSSIHQVQGALTMLEIEDALQLMKASGRLVEKFAASNQPPDPKDTELAAEAFSNFGPFVAAFQQGRENPHELLWPVLAHFGIGPKSALSQQ